MTQRFIKLGEGYGDTFELFTLIKAMPERVNHLIAFHTDQNGEAKTSLAVVFKPTTEGNFQPIYICLEGIPKTEQPNIRFNKFKQLAKQLNKKVIEMDVPSSNTYYEEDLYFQQLISILRLNHLLEPL
ncbi:DUF7147 family protein [Bacillaceae bacterium W0354]